MQRMHNPEREAKKADRISRSKTFKPRITSTDYDSFTFKCRLCMMGFRRRGMLVSAGSDRKLSSDLPLLSVTMSLTKLDLWMYQSVARREEKQATPSLGFFSLSPFALLKHFSDNLLKECFHALPFPVLMLGTQGLTPVWRVLCH